MFKVYSEQIPPDLIDNLLKCHEEFKTSPIAFFRAQGTTHFEKPILNEYGNQINSIHNPHLLGFNKKFSSLIESIITHPNISNCLSDFTGSKSHVWYQSMFFDKSTGTKLHQDTWYLDTIPSGKLVGVWIALENIEYPAGPFCLYTNTDAKKVTPDDFDFDNIEEDAAFKHQYPQAKRYDFMARKGDILIWDSLTIHGALLPKDDSMTRKSITAHFYPRGVPVQSPPIDRFISIYNHSQPRRSDNVYILKATTMKPLVYQSICLGLYMIEKTKALKSLVMRERSDKVADIRRLQ